MRHLDYLNQILYSIICVESSGVQEHFSEVKVWAHLQSHNCMYGNEEVDISKILIMIEGADWVDVILGSDLGFQFVSRIALICMIDHSL